MTSDYSKIQIDYNFINLCVISIHLLLQRGSQVTSVIRNFAFQYILSKTTHIFLITQNENYFWGYDVEISGDNLTYNCGIKAVGNEEIDMCAIDWKEC